MPSKVLYQTDRVRVVSDDDDALVFQDLHGRIPAWTVREHVTMFVVADRLLRPSSAFNPSTQLMHMHEDLCSQHRTMVDDGYAWTALRKTHCFAYRARGSGRFRFVVFDPECTTRLTLGRTATVLTPPTFGQSHSSDDDIVAPAVSELPSNVPVEQLEKCISLFVQSWSPTPLPTMCPLALVLAVALLP